MTDWQMGLLAFRAGRMREAVDRLIDALNEHELTVSRRVRYETCAYLGVALYTVGRPDDAVNAFEMAFRFSPELIPSADLTLNLVHSYLAAGRRTMAQEALRFLLAQAPGHVGAQMLARRLAAAPEEAPISGIVLGTSPESIRKYLRTLTFTSVSTGGYDPAQVRESLTHLERSVEALNRELAQAQETIASQEVEISRYRQMEDAMIDNMVHLQKLPSDPPANQEPALTPIEILFQRKN